MKFSLLIIDMQNDFVSPRGTFAQMGFEVKNLQKVIPAIRKFKESLKNIGIPAIYVVSHYDKIYLTNSIKERYKRNGYNIPFCISGTWGAQIVDELKPEKSDITVIKHRYNGFLGTNLELILKGTNIDTLIFTGVETHVCVQQTAIYGYMLGYNVILVEDCTASINETDKRYALEYCRKYYGLVKPSIEVLPIMKEK
ncbi:cysteine hydrolase [candidate division WOR-3 bacterium]|nr:cysteine hydrolase [candidate division WOR-3 bacterium]